MSVDVSYVCVCVKLVLLFSSTRWREHETVQQFYPKLQFGHFVAAQKVCQVALGDLCDCVDVATAQN